VYCIDSELLSLWDMLFISKHNASAVPSVTSGVWAKLFAPFITSTMQVLSYSKAWNNRFLCSA